MMRKKGSSITESLRIGWKHPQNLQRRLACCLRKSVRVNRSDRLLDEEEDQAKGRPKADRDRQGEVVRHVASEMQTHHVIHAMPAKIVESHQIEIVIRTETATRIDIRIQVVQGAQATQIGIVDLRTNGRIANGRVGSRVATETPDATGVTDLMKEVRIETVTEIAESVITEIRVGNSVVARS